MFILGILLVLSSLLFGDADEKLQLAKKAQNPLTAMISLPFQNNTDFGIGDYDRVRNTLNIQPVVPIVLGNWALINRLILPVVYGPDISSPEGGSFGLGDMSFTTWLAPPRFGKAMIGLGPSVIFPTSTDDLLGLGEWQMGPSAVFIFVHQRLVVGFLVSNYWSTAGGSENYLYGQYFLNYNFKEFYLTSSPIIIADWTAPSGEKWTVPFGLGIGKLFHAGIPINANLSYYYNAIRPTGAATGTLRIQFQLLFPGF